MGEVLEARDEQIGRDVAIKRIGDAHPHLVVASVTTSQSGQSAQFALGMSEAFSIDASQGSPTLTLSDGTVATYDSANSDPSAGALVFDDTLPANEQAFTLRRAEQTKAVAK